MEPHFRLYEYEFELKVKHCDIVTRIPCFYSLLWRLGIQSLIQKRGLSQIVEDQLPSTTG